MARNLNEDINLIEVKDIFKIDFTSILHLFSFVNIFYWNTNKLIY